jgi:hypothetical protein
MAFNGNDNFGKAHLGVQPWDVNPQPWKPIKQGGTAIEQYGGKGVRAGLERMASPNLQKLFNPMSKQFTSR